MSFKKLMVTGVIAVCTFTGSFNLAFAQNISYKVLSGDTFWIISSKYGISTDSLMKANNANQNTVLYPGQSLVIPLDSQSVHIVQSGETYWTISKKYNIDFNKLLSLNNANMNSYLNIGDTVVIPSDGQTPSKPADYILHTITPVDSFWTLSKKYNVDMKELMAFNGANENTQLIDGQTVKIPVSGGSSTPPSSTPATPPVQAPVSNPAPQAVSTKPYITYSTYTIQKGDTFWSLSDKFGVPAEEIIKSNNMNDSTYLSPQASIQIPVHHIPVKATPGPKYGELLDWWTEAQYVVPRGTVFKVVDFYTGKSFMAKRTGGSNHSDTEPLTLEDSKIMKEIWGGTYNWTRRPVVIDVNGRKVAASAAGMLHAGNDAAPALVWTNWRSDGYGAGINYDSIKGNGVDGHFDIHFLNSTRHLDGQLDPAHQADIKISSGIQ